MPLWPGTDDSDRNGQRHSKNLPLYGRFDIVPLE